MVEELRQTASIRIQKAVQGFWGFGLWTKIRLLPSSVLVAAGPSLHYLDSVGY